MFFNMDHMDEFADERIITDPDELPDSEEEDEDLDEDVSKGM